MNSAKMLAAAPPALVRAGGAQCASPQRPMFNVQWPKYPFVSVCQRTLRVYSSVGSDYRTFAALLLGFVTDTWIFLSV